MVHGAGGAGWLLVSQAMAEGERAAAPGVSPKLLRLALAYELQVKALGELPASARRELTQIAKGKRSQPVGAGILADRPELDDEGYVFSRAKPGRPLSVMALDMQMRRLKSDDTVHGFRSSFRDWVGEETAFPREVAVTR